MIKRNVFFNVIKKEDQFSQLLVNLVNTNEEIKEIVQKFFFKSSDIEIELFDTQLNFEYGRPDIIFNLSNGGKAIIEVKTQDSGLTKNQPNGYIEILQEDSNLNRYLFFLIPKFYNHEVEIRDRISKNPKRDSVHFKILYWNDLITELKVVLKPNENYEQFLMNELINHLNNKFGYYNIQFKTDQIELMYTNEIPSTILVLNKIIDSLQKSFGYKGIIWDNKQDGGYGSGYGFWYKKSIFIGYWFELWEGKNAPLILMVNKKYVDHNVFSSFNKYFSDHSIQSFGTSCKFIDLFTVIKEPNNTEIINRMITNFINQIETADGNSNSILAEM